MKKILTTLLLIAAATLTQANTYYVSTTGNDNNNGKTISEAWKTITKVNSVSFLPGDIILFQAGATFPGNIDKPSGASGTNGNPVTFGSYGGGKAIISSGNAEGIYIGNAGNVTIKNLVIKGAGYMTTSMWSNGINFYQEANSISDLDNITIDNVEVYGYGGFGILISTQSEIFGYNHVRITNSLLHDNGMGGCEIIGSWDDNKGLIRYNNTDVYVSNCKAYFNHGRSDYKDNWSGSGILISGTDGGLMEYCEAYENGKDNGYIGGPVGLWMGEAKNVTIQYCVSHHNRSGKTKNDGGGFDMDGGCYGGVIQHCESYENEGYGYALVQWETGNAWSNDTVRNNTSTNDARNIQSGAFTLWGADSKHKVTNAEVYGNAVTMDKPGQALVIFGNNFSNVQIHDNSFCVVAPATFSATSSTRVILSNNTFPCLVLSIKTSSFNVKRIS